MEYNLVEYLKNKKGNISKFNISDISCCWNTRWNIRVNAHFFIKIVVTLDFTTHGWSHIYGLPCPSVDSLDPMDWYYTLMFPTSSLKNTFLWLYMTFNPILASIHDFWPQTRIHQDVCINPNIFGVFLHVCLNHLTLGLL